MVAIPIMFFAALFIVPIMEVMVQCMPTRLRQASEQNYVRMDGTTSRRRRLRERLAISRLRFDLLVVLGIVFLIGAVGAVVMDSEVISLRTLGSVNGDKFDTRTSYRVPEGVREAQLDFAQKGKLVTASQVERYWPWLNTMLVLGLFGCLTLLGCGAMMAYGSFEQGVKTRADEYLRRDMARMRERDLNADDAELNAGTTR